MPKQKNKPKLSVVEPVTPAELELPIAGGGRRPVRIVERDVSCAGLRIGFAPAENLFHAANIEVTPDYLSFEVGSA